jgi:uncharacterized protein YndB with AHSA1/START domain
MQEALVVRRETHIPAPPAAVFALLTDPEKILRWMWINRAIDLSKQAPRQIRLQPLALTNH